MTDNHVRNIENHRSMKIIHAENRKCISRFRAKAKSDTSFALKAKNKTIFADDAAWTFAELAAIHTTRDTLYALLGPKKWIILMLLVSRDLGYIVRSIDAQGNFIFTSTPKLLLIAGQSAGELRDRRYFF